MIDINMVRTLVYENLEIKIQTSNLRGCSTTTIIYSPIITIDIETIVISSEHDENEIQINIDAFEYNQYNSSSNKLVFNSKFNSTDSLSIQGIDIE